jgi:hypothetical protein
MKIIPTLFAIVMAFYETVACDCHIGSLTQNQAQSYNNASLIFIGDVSHVDTGKGTYKVDLVEVLKGATRLKTLDGITPSSCSGFPTLGRWIIYAIVHESGTIEFSQCEMSRSFADPQFIMIKEYTYPLAPSGMGEMESTDAYIERSQQILAIKKRALDDLQKEITELRKRK